MLDKPPAKHHHRQIKRTTQHTVYDVLHWFGLAFFAQVTSWLEKHTSSKIIGQKRENRENTGARTERAWVYMPAGRSARGRTATGKKAPSFFLNGDNDASHLLLMSGLGISAGGSHERTVGGAKSIFFSFSFFSPMGQ